MPFKRGQGYWLGKHRSENTKKKLSLAHKDRPLTKIHKEHIRESLMGRTITKEWREKISKAKKGSHHTNISKLKMSEAHKGQIPWNKGKKNPYPVWNKGKHTGLSFMKGKHFDEQVRMKMSIARKGKSPWNKGKKGLYHHPPESRHKLSLSWKGRHHTSEAKRKDSEAHKLLWKNPDFRDKMSKALNLRPNKEELYLNAILQSYFPNEWKYVGDFKFWVDGKNPDFINVNGKKVVIEYNGHPLRHTPELDRAKTEHYAKYGFKTINLYPKDLKNSDALILKIREEVI